MPEIKQTIGSPEEKSKSSVDNLDNLFYNIGMGKWQALGLVANFMCWSFVLVFITGSVFWNPPIKFHCCQNVSSIQKSEHLPEMTMDQQTILSNSNIFDSQCLSSSFSETLLQIAANSSNEAICTDTAVGLNQNISAISLDGFTVVATGLHTCPFVAYDDSVFSSTVMIEWHLVCEQAGYFNYFHNFLVTGMAVACLIGGNLGDWFGRVKTLFIGSIVNVLGTALVIFASSFYWVMLGRFVSGFSVYTCMIVGFSWTMETCPTGYRGPLGMFSGVFMDGFLALFCLIAYYTREWRSLYLFIGWPSLLLVPMSWFMDESPRWLIRKRKPNEAVNILWKAAIMNNSTISSKRYIEELIKREAVTSEDVDEQLENKTFSDVKEVLSSWVMIHLLIAASVANFLNKLLLYAAYFSGNEFAGSNVFLFIGLSGVLDGTAIFLGIAITEYLGRKSGIAGTSLISGLLMIILLLVPDEYKTAQWFLLLSVILFTGVACQIISLYTPELFPTVVRARGLSFVLLFGILGTMAAPFILRVTVNLGWWIPGTIMALSGILCGLILLSLPETKGYPLCETVADVEKRAGAKARPSIWKKLSMTQSKFCKDRVDEHVHLVVVNNPKSYSN